MILAVGRWSPRSDTRGMNVEHALMPARIAERIVVCPTTGCWLWTGHLTRDGYGQVSWEGSSRPVHRVVWTLLVGDIAPLHDGTSTRFRECRTRRDRH